MGFATNCSLATSQSFTQERKIMNHSSTVHLLPSVEAELYYVAPIGERPRTYTYEPPAGVPRTTVVNEPHKVQIRDARSIISEVSLDEEGFALVHHRSMVRDFYDAEQVRQVYYPEAERLLKEA